MFINSESGKYIVIVFNKYKYDFAPKNVNSYGIRWCRVKRTCSVIVILVEHKSGERTGHLKF